MAYSNEINSRAESFVSFYLAAEVLSGSSPSAEQKAENIHKTVTITFTNWFLGCVNNRRILLLNIVLF